MMGNHFLLCFKHCFSVDGGFVVSEECGDVKVFGSSHKLVNSLSSKYGHQFGNPAGVCTDTEGNIIVADEQYRKIHLFPRSGSPICLVSSVLKKPGGLACSTHGLLLVADTGENSLVPEGMKELLQLLKKCTIINYERLCRCYDWENILK
uniref:NHL repeat containing 4 n=1 Tax=Sphenodon punctatus TaxID=8508 RepID=A0A8D0G8M9_SPHPU